jgi:two-component system, sensor histidine kinase PdtaS
MSNLHDGSTHTDNVVRPANSRWIARRAAGVPQSGVAAITAELKNALAREADLLRQKDRMLQQQALMAQEFEHRLINSLQLIVSLLSLQSRRAESPEAADQLMTAAKRVAAFERVHRQLHRLDQLATVELKQFVVQLCEDISGMVFDLAAPHQVVVEGAPIEISTALGVPLGFIVNELVTNAVKHGQGKIIVSLETTPELGRCLSVSNGGPSLPDGFDPGGSKRLGLRMVQALVRQINGRLQVGRGPGEQGACFKVLFPSIATV